MTVTEFDTQIASLGVEAFRVGGSVRDELIGRRPKDADYMVRGLELPVLGDRLRTLGSISKLRLRDGQHVGFRLTTNAGTAEVVLPRKEVSTGPGHSDFEIAADPQLTLEDDAKRRDFTFNALYKPLDGSDVLDPTGRGLYDLEHRFINVTHADSFRDDPLRILRALRFVARGFELGTNTRSMMQHSSRSIDGLTVNGHVSGTVYSELTKILEGDNVVEALRIARDTGVLASLLPELAPMIGFDQESRYHSDTVDEHTFKALSVAVAANAPIHVRWALLFHDSGKPEMAWRGKDRRLHFYAHEGRPDHADVGVGKWLLASARMNVPKKLRKMVASIIEHHMLGLETNPHKLRLRVRRDRALLGDDLYHAVLLHRVCDCGGKDKVNEKHVQRLALIAEYLDEARREKVPASVGDLTVTGRDVLGLGVEPKNVGSVLALTLDSAIQSPDEEHSRLLERAARMY